MSHWDKGRCGPIGTYNSGKNASENCVPRNCKEHIDGRNEALCDPGVGFMRPTDVGVPQQPVIGKLEGTCAANLLYQAVVSVRGEIKPCCREYLLCC